MAYSANPERPAYAGRTQVGWIGRRFERIQSSLTAEAAPAGNRDIHRQAPGSESDRAGRQAHCRDRENRDYGREGPQRVRPRGPTEQPWRGSPEPRRASVSDLVRSAEARSSCRPRSLNRRSRPSGRRSTTAWSRGTSRRSGRCSRAWFLCNRFRRWTGPARAGSDAVLFTMSDRPAPIALGLWREEAPTP
jgi:hypothetical protein